MWTISNRHPAKTTPAHDPVTIWLRDRLHFRPDAQQRSVLAGNPSRALFNCCLHWGKSTFAAARAVYQARTSPGSLTVVITPDTKSCVAFFRLAAQFVGCLERTGRPDNHKMLLNFRNRSRILGFSSLALKLHELPAPALVIVDDAARINDRVYKAVEDFTAGGAIVWLLSKPFGKRGFFYHLWAHGGSAWRRVHVPATACPRISRKSVEKARTHVFHRTFRQEYLCEFAELREKVFDPAVVLRAFRDDVPILEFD